MKREDLNKLCDVIFHISAAEEAFSSMSRKAQAEVRAEYTERLITNTLTDRDVLVWLFGDAAKDIIELNEGYPHP